MLNLTKKDLPNDTSVRAEYYDGFILDETTNNDISPYDARFNILRAILNKDPEPKHGLMVKFTVFWHNRRYDIDWTTLPTNARPIRFRDGNLRANLDSEKSEFWWSGCRFGYQFTDEDGKNHQKVQELN